MAGIERKVVDTILQKPIEFSIGGKTYVAPSPTLGTLLMVSEKISELPEEFGQSDSVAQILHDAKYSRLIAEICSIYILGAKAITMAENRPLISRIIRKAPNISSKVQDLVNEVLFEWTPNDVGHVFTLLLEKSNLSDFFGVSTFLKEVSLTKPTKVEKN